jgi:Nitrile hydratase beta subunit
MEEWAAALADELRAAEDRGEPDDGTHYYAHWLAAPERLVVEKGLTDRGAIANAKSRGRRISLYLARVQSGGLRSVALEAGRAEVLVGSTGSKDAVGGHHTH